MSDIWGIILAGGSGTRFGARKQYFELDGRSLLTWAIEAMRPVVDHLVVVLPEHDDVQLAPDVIRADGGLTRLDSVRSALAVIPNSAEIVLIGGASHPLASTALMQRTIQAVRDGADAATPALPMLETLKRIDERSMVLESIPKHGVVVTQSPQAFRAPVLRAAHEGSPDAVEDLEVVEHIGGSIIIVEGEPGNVHIARPVDLELAQAIVRGRLDGTEPHQFAPGITE